MNKDNAAEFLPLVKALAEEKTIEELRTVHVSTEAWTEVKNPIFSRPVEFYRIKPEPRRVWVCFGRLDGKAIHVNDEPCPGHNNSVRFVEDPISKEIE